jgi:hypothetical protein
MRTIFPLLLLLVSLIPSVAASTPNDSQKILLTYPNNGESFHVGDTVTVQWNCTTDIPAVDIEFSPDTGKTWIFVNLSSIMYDDAVSWRHYQWIIPDTISSAMAGMPGQDFPLAGNSACYIRVEQYAPTSPSQISVCAKALTILKRKNGVIRNPISSVNHSAGLRSPVSVTLGGQVRSRTAPFRQFDMRGKTISGTRPVPAGLILNVYRPF